MKKLNILRCGDQRNWAYDFISQEHAKYSRHNIQYAKWDDIELNNKDLIYIHSPDITNYHANTLPLQAKEQNIKVIGGYAGNPLFWGNKEKKTYIYSDLIVTISPQTYSFSLANYQKIPIIYLPESIDTNFFIPTEFRKDSFVVGWAGGKHKPIKRSYICDKLNYKIIFKDDWQKQRDGEYKNLPLSGMRDFYQSIDVLIVTSKSECQPRVVMEAMACGIPVVATNVGSMKMLLDDVWIVPKMPEDELINEMNKCLSILKNYPYLRKEIGKRNRYHVSKYFSWEKNTKIWDDTFYNIYNGNVERIKNDSDSFLNNFKDLFTSELLDFGNTAELSENQIIYNFFDRLNYFCKFDYWLSEESCLECIKYNKMVKKVLTLGVNTEENKKTIENKLIEINLDILNVKINVVLERHVTKTKINVFNTMAVKVPFPVVSYLISIFGKEWDK